MKANNSEHYRPLAHAHNMTSNSHITHCTGTTYSRSLTVRGENTIRVLKLSTWREKSETGSTGALIETSLENPLPYAALSYRWGGDLPQTHIAFIPSASFHRRCSL